MLRSVRWLGPIVVDVLLVVLFCVIGRRSHEEAILAGLLHTAWPFATGLAVGWVAAYLLSRRRPETEPFNGMRLRPTGLVIWSSTLVVGMALRVVSGQGTAVSFIIVAASVLALFLLGWRAAVRAIN
ncbi:DUF3054 domain-containing protein [Nocardia speluncae]|uniref:DUF3054 domain-containing protein n=1 Tax=Nocardia speluncae TaxID=419477 RepID=A0A846XQZ1_9NOCA|nr:DUF3054 domain-containing protein [Nocardia speluncae]NKY37665.1 DUF3054 domain-containing protein [Nocardia speluncae]